MNRVDPKIAASGHRGVYPNRNGWQARISIAGEFIHLGHFATKEEAAEAYRLRRARKALNRGKE